MTSTVISESSFPSSIAFRTSSTGFPDPGLLSGSTLRTRRNIPLEAGSGVLCQYWVEEICSFGNLRGALEGQRNVVFLGEKCEEGIEQSVSK